MHKITTIILLFVTVSSFNYNLQAQNWDIELLEKINSNTNPVLKGYSTFVSESVTVFAVGAPAIIGIIGLIQHDDTKLRNVLYIGSSLAVDGVLTYGLKAAINRTRPAIDYPQLIDPYKDLRKRSMPSGHTSLAFATATSLSITYPEWYVIVPSYFWACSVGYSRMHLGVHYPSDVLAGALLGAGSAYLTKKVNDWWWEKRDAKKLKVFVPDSPFEL